jgi:hypothetical protein
VAELERLRWGEGTEAEAQGRRRAAEQLAELVLALAQAAFQARVTKSSLPPDAAEALAQIEQLPPPLGAVGPFLRAVADGEVVPPVPAGLPDELGQILRALVEAVP